MGKPDGCLFLSCWLFTDYQLMLQTSMFLGLASGFCCFCSTEFSECPAESWDGIAPSQKSLVCSLILIKSFQNKRNNIPPTWGSYVQFFQQHMFHTKSWYSSYCSRNVAFVWNIVKPTNLKGFLPPMARPCPHQVCGLMPSAWRGQNWPSATYLASRAK